MQSLREILPVDPPAVKKTPICVDREQGVHRLAGPVHRHRALDEQIHGIRPRREFYHLARRLIRHDGIAATGRKHPTEVRAVERGETVRAALHQLSE